MKDMLLSLADELEGMDVREGCRTCPADGTKDCRGDLSCEEAVARAVARRVREIVEHDGCEVTTVSAYDLLPEDEREAIAWVREQGGLDLVKASAHQGAMEHGYLLRIAHALGTSIYDGTDNADALLDKLEKRLMPEGMEWPRFEDDAPIKFGDEFADGLGNTRKCQSVELLGGDDGVCDAAIRWGEHDCDFMLVCAWQGERVKRPAPKAVDADGVEIRVGDTVWTDYGDGPWTVTKITTAHAWHVYGHSDELGSLDMQPNLLTHRAPVLAADGKPLEAGQTVYAKNYGYVKCTVLAIEWVVDGYLVEVENEGGHKFRQTPDEFTHERPDSWERLEHDAEKTVCEYFGANYDCANCPLESARCAEEVKKDIVRRAKKLAERGA